MTEANEFYVTLPSNVHTVDEYFPQNTVAHYITKLVRPIKLVGEYEVGVAEVSYTLSWFNVSHDEKLELMYFDNGMPKTLTHKNAKLSEGRYDTIKQIIVEITEGIAAFAKSPNFPRGSTLPEIEVNKFNRHVTLKHGKDDKNRAMFLSFSKNLCDILGFNHNEMITYYGSKLIEYAQKESQINPTGGPNFKHEEPKGELISIKAKRPYDLSGGFHSLFIYSNIVKPSFVGDTYTQLLRLVNIPSKDEFGDQILINYPNVYYIPLLVQEFETIEIQITNEMGELIPFEFGRSFVTLHFRKKL